MVPKLGSAQGGPIIPHSGWGLDSGRGERMPRVGAASPCPPTPSSGRAVVSLLGAHATLVAKTFKSHPSSSASSKSHPRPYPVPQFPQPCNRVVSTDPRAVASACKHGLYLQRPKAIPFGVLWRHKMQQLQQSGERGSGSSCPGLSLCPL